MEMSPEGRDVTVSSPDGLLLVILTNMATEAPGSAEGERGQKEMNC